ncbi:albumin-2-like [Vicia villosa]|uniref:albumin-2-like n=1 Tax=Vicia villosa TaxID=3911 RepID=UPI00273CDC2A|nr:albumin-2-like [Vicia villosa]
MTKPGYINAAFRSSFDGEVYLFIDDKYVLLNYAPGTTNDKVLNGPKAVSAGFKSLVGTAFGIYGIDGAFSTDNDEAFIFYENLTALIDYAPHTEDDQIISGPKKISDMFPFFKGTVFENGIDAAFRSSIGKEVYLFKGNQYAHVDYGNNYLVQSIKNITAGFPCFTGTVFENGVDAAFASHRSNEAYFFKGDYYALVKFDPTGTDDYIIGTVKLTLENWPSLRGIIPQQN